MSHYLDFKTAMIDQEALKQALTHMATPQHERGLPVTAIEVHNQAQHLYGYGSDKRGQTAEIIIRRGNVQHMANDIGFSRKSDGTFGAVISEFDQRYFNPQWLTRLGTYYNYEKAKMEMDTRKVEYQEEVDQKGRLQLKVVFKQKQKKKVGITL